MPAVSHGSGRQEHRRCRRRLRCSRLLLLICPHPVYPVQHRQDLYWMGGGNFLSRVFLKLGCPREKYSSTTPPHFGVRLFNRLFKSKFCRLSGVTLLTKNFYPPPLPWAYTGHFWVNFSKFFSRSLSTQDGFLTLPNDDLAGFTLCTCIFAFAFVPFVVGRKVPFFVPLQCSVYRRGGAI